MTSKHLGACHCCWQASICLPSFLISRCKSMSLCCPYKNHDTGFAGKHLSSWNSDGNGVIWRLLLKGIHHFSNIQQTRGDAQKVEMSADGTSVRCEIYGIFKINFSLDGNSPKLSQFCHRSTKKLNFLYAMKSFFEWRKSCSLWRIALCIQVAFFYSTFAVFLLVMQKIPSEKGTTFFLLLKKRIRFWPQ